MIGSPNGGTKGDSPPEMISGPWINPYFSFVKAKTFVDSDILFWDIVGFKQNRYILLTKFEG
jgi:hypothetical protein